MNSDLRCMALLSIEGCPYQTPLSLPVSRYATRAETARGGSKGSRDMARKSRCKLALSSCEP